MAIQEKKKWEGTFVQNVPREVDDEPANPLTSPTGEATLVTHDLVIPEYVE